MPSIIELMGAGVPASVANQIGHTLHDTVTAAGTTQGTAATIAGTFVNVTTAAANSGIILPTAATQPTIVVINNGANTLKVYPAVGEKINAGSANAAFSIGAGKSCIFTPFSQQWAATLSA